MQIARTVALHISSLTFTSTMMGKINSWLQDEFAFTDTCLYRQVWELMGRGDDSQHLPKPSTESPMQQPQLSSLTPTPAKLWDLENIYHAHAGWGHSWLYRLVEKHRREQGFLLKQNKYQERTYFKRSGPFKQEMGGWNYLNTQHSSSSPFTGINGKTTHWCWRGKVMPILKGQTEVKRKQAKGELLINITHSKFLLMNPVL